MDTAVAITGTGCVNYLGNTVTDFIKGADSIFHNPAVNETSNPYCEIKNFLLTDEINIDSYPRLDISLKYLLSSVHEALKSAGLPPAMIAGNSRVGVVIGSCFGLGDSQYKFLNNLFVTGRANSILFQQTANNLLSGFISYQYHTNGIHFTVHNGCTSGLDALMIGQQMIVRGEADIVITGGVDQVNQFVLEYYHAVMKKKHTGSGVMNTFIPGEGAGVVILENFSEANRRGRRILGRLTSGGQTMFYTNADFCTSLKDWICDSGFERYYVNFNRSRLDLLEMKLIKKMSIADKVIALKPLIGECGGASGILQLIHALHRADQKNFIFNACFSGRMSYIIVESSV